MEGFKYTKAIRAYCDYIDRHLANVEASWKLLQEKCMSMRFVYDDCTARQAADHMVNHNIGRLPVISRQQPHSLVGIVTRSDILSGYRLQMDEAIAEKPTISIPGFKKNKDSIGRKVDDDSNS